MMVCGWGGLKGCLAVVRLSGLLGVLLAALVLAGAAHAHPEDDICGPDSGLDPALCQSLSAIEGGAPGDAVSRLADASGSMSWSEALVAFFVEGWNHVLPDGLDHLLFVVALFLSTLRLRLLVAQVSAFTLAHTVTVGLSAAGVIAPPSAVVEPLIAASIAIVAVEAVVFSEPPRWRLAIVFLFGLVHGMGFAGAFSAASSDGSVFWPGLAGFNLGVEAAQLAAGVMALAVAAALRALFLRDASRDTVRQWLIRPACILIGLAGCVWTVQALGWLPEMTPPS